MNTAKISGDEECKFQNDVALINLSSVNLPPSDSSRTHSPSITVRRFDSLPPWTKAHPKNR